MSFDQKKKDNMELDDMNIKSHLNNSLEESGIRVSEDLINRTMEAIRKQTAETSIKEEHQEEVNHKVIPFSRYIRGFATVAAAALILVVGFNTLRMMNVSKDESSKESPNYSGAEYDSSLKMSGTDRDMKAADTADSATEQFVTMAENTTEEATDNGVSANLAIEEGVTEVAPKDAGELETKITASEAEPVGFAAQADQATFTFLEICPIPLERVESVHITESATGLTIFLSNRADIDEFFSLLERFTYTDGTAAVGENRYVIEIKSSDASFLIIIGENNITTSYSEGNQLIENNYNTSDQQQLIKDLEEFYQR